MRTLLYTRVSTEKQEDNFSLQSQIDAMRAEVERRGWTVSADLIETEGASEYSEGLARTKLNTALEMAARKQIDALCVYAADRFTRNPADGVLLRRQLWREGVRLYFFSPSFREVTRDEEILHILTDWQSAQYVEKLREAVLRGLSQKAKEGAYPQGRCPYGYTIVGQKRESRLEIVPEHAEVVRLVFIWFLVDRLTTSQIARRLTEAAIPTPSEVRGTYGKVRKRQAGEWSQNMVYEILRNESYTGVWYSRYRTIGKGKATLRPREEWTAIAIPAIVDRVTWERAQEFLKRRAPRSGVYRDLMSRRVWCTCGAKMHGMTGAKLKDGSYNRYYECMSRSEVKGKCGAPYYRVDLVDAVVWDWLCKLVADPARVLADFKEAQATMNERHALLRTHIANADEQIAEHTARLSDLIEQRAAAKHHAVKAALDAKIEEAGRIIDELTAKRDTLLEQLERETITDEAIGAALNEVDAVRDELEDIIRTNDFQAKRRLVEALNITATLRVDRDGQRWVDIHWCLKTYPERLPKPIRRAILTKAGRSRSARCRA